MALEFDVIIVGAGFAGAAAATVLGRERLRVALIDPRPEYPPEFKAEKIEPEHADALRRLHLAERLLPARHASMRSSKRTTDVCCACDRSSNMGCGVRRRPIRSRHSLCVGFDITRADGSPFPFDALTYWADSPESGIDFISLFTVPGAMRVNLFGYLDLRDPWLRLLIEAPHVAIDRAMPKLTRIVGDWRAISRVEIRAIDLYVTDVPRIDGAVLVGDAWQSVCPATGTGPGKVVTDVEVLCRTHIGATRRAATPNTGAASSPSARSGGASTARRPTRALRSPECFTSGRSGSNTSIDRPA